MLRWETGTLRPLIVGLIEDWAVDLSALRTLSTLWHLLDFLVVLFQFILVAVSADLLLLV